MTDAFDYAMRIGVTIESSYPYQEGWGQNCLIDGGDYKINKYWRIHTQTCSSIISAVADNGPLSVGVYATNDWFSYSSDVFSCAAVPSATAINHAVLIVGFTE